MRKRIGCLLAAGVTLATVSGARANVVDSALPVLPGSGDPVSIIYTMTGVADSSEVATVVHCTFVGTGCADVGLQVFDYAGGLLNDAAAGNGYKEICAGYTFTFGTSDTSVYTIDEQLTLSGGVNQGSARIVATSKKLLCTAQVVDKVNNPPTSAVRLPLFPKLKQKGD